jgi:transposase
LDEGLSKSAIAERLGVSRGVIYHWLATGQLDWDLDAPSPRAAARRPTKLDAYHGIIGERLATWPELSAVRLFEDVRAAGYSGGITQLRDFVAPGHQAQVDFATFKFP